MNKKKIKVIRDKKRQRLRDEKKEYIEKFLSSDDNSRFVLTRIKKTNKTMVA